MDAALPPVPNATELAATILEETAAVPLPETVAAPPLPELPAASAQLAAAEPVQTGADAAPPPEPVSQPVPKPDPEPVPEPQPAQPQPEAPAVRAEPVQQEPVNVNVSVRIGSPGDDGAVTQVNVAVDDPPAQYQPEPPQYQPVVPPSEPASPGAGSVAPVADEPPASPVDGWEWTWNWSCGDAPVGDIAIPFDVGTRDWTWNWNWICGGGEPTLNNNVEETITGYRAPVTQYRPVNINVSIRIASPGDNGPVVQANVAVGVTVPVPVLVQPPVRVEPPVAAPAAEPATAEAAATSQGDATAAPVEAAPAEEQDGCCQLPGPRGVPYDPEPPVSVVLAAREPVPAGDTTLAERDTVAIAARFELRARRAAAAAAAPPRPQARPARPSSTSRVPGDEGQPILVQGGLGFAPLNGSDQVWPYAVLMVFAFVFASVSLSRASARSRPTPAADPDDRPERPG